MTYDAFISYSKRGDERLAVALQRGLQQLGRPVDPDLGLRSLVFRGSHLVASFPAALPSEYPVIVIDWPLAIDDLKTAACETATRDLTADEWTQWVGPFDPYDKTCTDADT